MPVRDVLAALRGSVDEYEEGRAPRRGASTGGGGGGGVGGASVFTGACGGACAGRSSAESSDGDDDIDGGGGGGGGGGGSVCGVVGICVGSGTVGATFEVTTWSHPLVLDRSLGPLAVVWRPF